MNSQLDWHPTSLHPRLSDWRGVGYHAGETPPATSPMTFPAGVHVLTDPIVLASNQVLKGAGRDVTTLRFTKSLFDLFGAGDWQAGGVTSPGWSTGGGLITSELTTEIGIEDLTIEFPAHLQAAHFYEVGFNALFFGKVTNFWVRRVRIVNSDSGIFCYKCTSSLFQDVELRWPGVTKNAAGHVAHYGVMLGRDCTKMLIDGLDCNDLCRHDTDVANNANLNVVMRSRFKDYVCSHHGGAPHHNLFTDIDVGLGTRVFVDSGGSTSAMPHNGPGEVFWNLRKATGAPISGLPPFTGTRYWRRDLALIGHTQNLLNTDLTKEWVEGISPVEPTNVYLAQREGIPPPPPPPDPHVTAKQKLMASTWTPLTNEEADVVVNP